MSNATIVKIKLQDSINYLIKAELEDIPTCNTDMIWEKIENTSLYGSPVKVEHSEILHFKAEPEELEESYSRKHYLCIDETMVKQEPLNSLKPEISSTNLIKCPKCLFTSTKNATNKHFKKVHVNQRIKCKYCKVQFFKNIDSLESHILNQHADNKKALLFIKTKVFKCSSCSYRSLKKNNFERHLATHKNLTQNVRNMSVSKLDLHCYHCSYETTDRGSLIKHVRLHRSRMELPFFCKECQYKCNEKKTLDAHIVKHHFDNEELAETITNSVFKCEHCEYRDVSKCKVQRHKKACRDKKKKCL
ncbi:hypothetical protein ABEB36_005593 [Hypothenemus hampei]|uniref:C2H2-type domain-containing protein n=1 Tax=Hypothenemus hampei TaxID=57062 RepID=A0ABD1EYS1_HYPHA